ncbi:MAG: methyltransferase [Methylococcaceae bacterium]
MKICTDSLLFGAMAPVTTGAQVLDIGTGTGILALIAAQLGAASVTAVELIEPTYHEAQHNFSRSPWPERLHARHQSIQAFAENCTVSYDLIISNPPFFNNQSKSTNPHKKTARHDDQLANTELIQIARKLLKPDGLFFVLVSVTALNNCLSTASAAGLQLQSQTFLRGFVHNPARVCALGFSFQAATPTIQTLTIYEAAGVYSPASRLYLSDFLLRFATQQPQA